MTSNLLANAEPFEDVLQQIDNYLRSGLAFDYLQVTLAPVTA